jgi:hypothetical protein
MSDRFTPHARPDVEAHVMPDGTTLLFDPISEEGHVLDVLGSLVWDYCDGKMTSDAIIADIEALGPQFGEARAAVLALLHEFAERTLLVSCDPAASS